MTLNTKPQEFPYLQNYFARTFYSPADHLDNIADIIQDDFSTFIGPGNLEPIITDLNRLIERDYPEEQLKEIIVDLGMWTPIDIDDYKPTSHTYKEWIVDLRNILQNELKRRIEG